ncbi:ATP-binding protein [Sphingomonas sp. HF-S4]|uniref:histidine kinase n=1 Tax=Sphingomonas agrestis TaxID=3080540 RepID=A0ABU3YAL3_9SPHN|nr:ATP-binding protein [Sphingomonas sp. HF-S4]MDV3458434.1 ATP-binding protein [Sphingomonas sp. HF-S4]
MKLRGTPSLGLITNVALPGILSGWDMARIVRDYNRHAAIGYLSGEGQRDWAMLGVPNSIVIGSGAIDYEIPDAFFSFCGKDEARRGADAPVAQQWQRLGEIVRGERSTLYAHFQHTSNLIAVLEGPDHRYTFANTAYLQLVERNVVGKTVIEAFPEVIGQGYVEILDRVFTTGEEFIGHRVEFDMARGDGTKRALLDLIYRPMHGNAGAITGILVEGTDLTASHAAQGRIDALQNDLIHVARVNAMGLLASTLAHELNQPLTAISNFLSAAKMMSHAKPVDPKILECVEGATTSALRAGFIIRRLRNLTVKGPASRQDVAIDSVVREAVAIACTGRFEAKVECDFQSRGLVHVDPIQLQQVILNFLQNAFDASDTSEAHIAISTADSDTNVECQVRDSGTGIPRDVLSRIFDSFVTTKTEGMGIGLSLSKTIIESHGGSIAARNNPDRGATLSFTLPRVE